MWSRDLSCPSSPGDRESGEGADVESGGVSSVGWPDRVSSDRLWFIRAHQQVDRKTLRQLQKEVVLE